MICQTSFAQQAQSGIYAPDTVKYPIYCKFEIQYTGSQIIKDLEIWVYDANHQLLYYSIQSIPTDERYADIIVQIVDKEFKEWMMRHGYVLKNRYSIQRFRR